MARGQKNKGGCLDFGLNNWVNCGTVTEVEKTGEELVWGREGGNSRALFGIC